jgi:hypothetical protein
MNRRPHGTGPGLCRTGLTKRAAAGRGNAQEYRYVPRALDPGQALIKHTGATVTPQAAVLSAEGKLLYLGRIDNRVEDFGKTRPRATENDVRNALDAVLSGKPVAHATTKSIGCAIPGKTP